MKHRKPKRKEKAQYLGAVRRQKQLGTIELLGDAQAALGGERRAQRDLGAVVDRDRRRVHLRARDRAPARRLDAARARERAELARACVGRVVRVGAAEQPPQLDVRELERELGPVVPRGGRPVRAGRCGDAHVAARRERDARVDRAAREPPSRVVEHGAAEARGARLAQQQRRSLAVERGAPPAAVLQEPREVTVTRSGSGTSHTLLYRLPNKSMAPPTGAGRRGGNSTRLGGQREVEPIE